MKVTSTLMASVDRILLIFFDDLLEVDDSRIPDAFQRLEEDTASEMGQRREGKASKVRPENSPSCLRGGFRYREKSTGTQHEV